MKGNKYRRRNKKLKIQLKNEMKNIFKLKEERKRTKEEAEKKI